MSRLLNTGLDRETLSILVTLCESGVNPEALAVVVKELRILGSRCGPHPMALELLGRHDFQVHKFVEAEYPLARAEEAMEHARRRGALKVVLVMPTHAL